MQISTSSTLTVLHDGQFWVGLCERTEGGRYGAQRVVFGATEPSDTEILAFVCARWATLSFDMRTDTEAKETPLAGNPKRRQREARASVQRAGVGTKAQQAMSASYEEHKLERKAQSREARRHAAEEQFALKQQKRKQKHRGR